MLPLLLVAALVLVILTVDPSRYRPAIESQVQRQLGLKLQLQGNLHWKLWPLLAIESGAGTLQAPLLSWQHLVFNADLLALLRRRWIMDSLQIEGLRLDLRRDASGRDNWDLPASNGPAGTLQLQLKRLTLRDANLSYQDAGSGSQWHVGPLELELGARVDRQGQGTQLSVTDIKLKLAGGQLQGSVQGALAEEMAHSALQGRIEFQTTGLREFLQALGIKPPATRDAATLGAAQFSMEWAMKDQQLDFKLLQLRLDATKLAGSAHVDLRGDAPQLQLDLQGDTVQLDRYRSPEGTSSEPFTLPVAALKSLPVTGVIQLDSAEAQGVTLKGVRLRLVGAP